MPLGFLLALPFALDGDSADPNNGAIAVIGVVSIVGGYLLLAALWYFVFRPRRQDKDEHPAPQPETLPAPVHPRERRRIDRSHASPFRRR